MLEDVRLSLEGKSRVHFYGRPGGVISTPQEIAEKIKEIKDKGKLEGIWTGDE